MNFLIWYYQSLTSMFSVGCKLLLHGAELTKDGTVGWCLLVFLARWRFHDSEKIL